MKYQNENEKPLYRLLTDTWFSLVRWRLKLKLILKLYPYNLLDFFLSLEQKLSNTKCASYKINDDDDMFVAMKSRAKTTTTATEAATASETY